MVNNTQKHFTIVLIRDSYVFIRNAKKYLQTFPILQIFFAFYQYIKWHMRSKSKSARQIECITFFEWMPFSILQILIHRCIQIQAHKC
jgi:hypothetical protein